MKLLLLLTVVILLIQLPCGAQSDTSTRGLWELAIKAQVEGRLDSAIEYYKRSLQLKADAVVYYNLGTAYQADKKFDLAIESYQSALKLREKSTAQEPDFIRLYHGLATSFQHKKSVSEALNNYELLAQCLVEKSDSLDVTLSDVYCQIAQLHQQNGDSKKALEMYKKALGMVQPNSKNEKPMIASQIAYLLQVSNNNVEAEQFYRKALEDKPEWQTYYNLGTAMQAAGTTSKAQDNYEKALCRLNETEPRSSSANEKGADMYYGLATVYDGAKNYEKALHNYKLALENAGAKDMIHPADICFAIGRVYELIGSRHEAIAYFKRSAKMSDSSKGIDRYFKDQQIYSALANLTGNSRQSRKWRKRAEERTSVRP